MDIQMNSNIKISLKNLLIISFVVQIVFVTGFTGYISFKNGKKAIKEHSFLLRNELTLRIKDIIGKFLNEPLIVNQSLANSFDLEYLPVNNKIKIRPFFWKQIKLFKRVNYVAIGTEEGQGYGYKRQLDGSFVSHESDSSTGYTINYHNVDTQGNLLDIVSSIPKFDARTRPWYISAKQSGKAIWTGVYPEVGTKSLQIAATLPLYNDQQEFMGVLATTFFFSHIDNFLKKMEIGKTGQAFLIERNGLLLSSSVQTKTYFLEKGNPKRIKGSESENILVNHASKYIEEKFNGLQHIIEMKQLNFKINDSEYFLQVAPYNDEHGIDWLIVVVIPEVDFMEQINKNNYFTLILILLALTISIVGSILTANSVVRPLNRINLAAADLAQGNWDRELIASSIYEVNDLATSFNRMGKQVEQRTKKLSSVNKKMIEERELLNAIIDNIPVLITRYDPRANMLYLNKAFERIIGWKTEEVVNIDMMEEVYPDPEYRQQAFDYMQKNSIEWKEFKVRAKSGDIVDSEWSNIKLEDGTQIGIGIDITERKKLESNLKQAQKMESIGTLAGGIAHDFNNILYPIIGFSEMLKEDLPPDSPEHESAQEIFNAGRRGGELVKQILAFSRQTEHKLSPVHFQKILTEVCKLTRSTIPSDIEIHHDIQKDCGLVMAESSQLHQIAMNLITNAYHAVEKTSGEISIKLKEIMLDNDDLKDSPLKPGQYVMLSVSDNGVGIPREIKNNIFEPYFTTKGKGKGTGLGLAVVYGILTEHKGDIKVYSEVGKGTTFNVYLPLMKKDAEKGVADQVSQIEIGTENLLLVDDEVSVAKLEKLMLERLGYKVTVQTNSVDALTVFEANPESFDLVITDMTMPAMTGDQLAREILLIKPDIPIIICTGFSERVNKEQAQVIGVKGFLMKPVIKFDMAQMVRKILDEAKNSNK